MSSITREEIERTFALRMRAARNALGLSQRAFAEGLEAACGAKLDPSAVTRIETGQRPVSLVEAVWIADFLNIPVFDDGAT